MDEIGDPVLNISELPLPLLTECFNHLSPRDLACASAVCTAWQHAVTTQPWQRFFHLHFGSDDRQDEEEEHQHEPSYWISIYNKKMQLTSQCWKTSTSPPCDLLHRHYSNNNPTGPHQADFHNTIINNVHADFAGIKTCKLIHGGTYVYTGGLDRRISCWNIHTGMLQCTSSLHAGTIRRLAADEKALVSAASDKRIRLFPATTPPTCSNSTTTTDWYYDITITDSRRLVSGTLRGHTGPITALALTPTTIISGSWDYTIKVWDRKDLSNPIQSITLDDWVVDCTLVCNKRLLHVVTTTSVLSFAITGVGCIASPVPLFKVLDCSVTTMGCVAATEDGGWLMYGGGGGESGGAVVVAVDLKRRRKKMVLATSLSLSQQQQRQQQSVVTCMHWEYPQLAVGTSSGDLVLLDLEKLIQTNTDSKSSNSANSASGLPYEGADAMVASQDTISITSTEKIPSGIYMGLGPNIMVPHRKIPTTMATVGTTTSGGGVVVGGGGGPQSSSSSYNNVSSRYAFTTTAATLEQQHSILQSVDRYNGWLVAGFGNGSILTWDGRSALERQHVADKARVARRNARLAKKIDSGKGKGKGKKGGGGYKGEEEKSSVQRVMNELEQGEKKEEEEEDEGEVDDVDIEVGNCMTDSDDHDNEVTRSSLFPLLSTTPTINDDDDDDALVGGSSRRKKPSLIVPGPITATNGGGVGGVGTNVLSRGGESCRQEAWHVLKRRPASVTVPPPP